MGSIEQPDSIEKGLDFWNDMEGVQVHEGVDTEFMGESWWNLSHP